MSPTYHNNAVAECKFHDLSGTGFVGNDDPTKNM
jgi:hypothetical protein